MDIKAVPGMSLRTTTLRRRGIAVLLVAVLVVAGAVAWTRLTDTRTELTLRVARAAPGIKAGAPVQISGFPVGTVSAVRPLEGGHAGVVMKLNDSTDLTDRLQVEFASGNLFGVAEVVLRPRPGGAALRDGAVLTPLSAATDNTVASILTLVATVNNNAIRPNAGALIAGVNRTTTAAKSWLTTLGAIAQAVSETEKIRPGETLPIWADVIGAASANVPSVLDALTQLNTFAQAKDPTWAALLTDSVDANVSGPDSTIGAARAILTPEAARSLDQAAPLLSALADPLVAALGDRPEQAGLDLEKVLHLAYGALPSDATGPTLAVAVQTPPGNGAR